LSTLYPREKVSSGRVFPPFLRLWWQILEKTIVRNVAQNLPKWVFEYSVLAWKSQLWKGFCTISETLMTDSWKTDCQKCGSKSAKTSFWVLCTIVKKSALEGFFHHFWNMDDRFLRYWLQKCASKPAKKIFSMLCKLVKKSVLEGFSQHFCETRMTRSFKILFRVVGQDSQNAFSDAIDLRETIRFWPFFKHISETIIY
jgi:hypothetical protein